MSLTPASFVYTGSTKKVFDFPTLLGFIPQAVIIFNHGGNDMKYKLNGEANNELVLTGGSERSITGAFVSRVILTGTDADSKCQVQVMG